jgi:hypothetical protein
MRSAAAIPTMIAAVEEVVSMTERMLADMSSECGSQKGIRKRQTPNQ